MLKITIDDSQLQAAFRRLKLAATDARPAFQDISEYTLRRVDSTFRDEKDWYGSPWAALKPRTIKQKQKKRQITKILQATGLFRASFSSEVGTDFAEIGSNRVGKNGVSIGILHQLSTRKMPKRETLPNERQGLPPSDQQEVLSIIGDHIESAW